MEQSDQSKRTGMKDILLHFITSQESKPFLESREQVLQHSEYEPYSSDLDKLRELLDKKEFDKVATYHNINVLLSPRAHLLKKFAFDELKDERGAKAELMIAQRVMEHITLTGDGSKEKPYLVLRVDDEKDVLSYLGERFSNQALMQDEGKWLDVIHTQSGRDIYFDITDCYTKLQSFSEQDFIKMLQDDISTIKEEEKKKPWWKFW